MSSTRLYNITTTGPSVTLSATGGSPYWEDNAKYRFSYHKEAGLWSDWQTLTLKDLNDRYFKEKTLFIEIEVTEDDADDFPTLVLDEGEEQECELPYTTTNENTTDSDDDSESCTASIKILECEDADTTFNPYSVGSASTIYDELSSIVSDTFGWDTRYFRTTPVRKTADYIFHEYSLKNVSAANNVKVLIEDNNLPSRSFAIHNPLIDYQESLTVHIVKDEFHNAFGSKAYPREHDYLAFSFKNFNKMYEVIGVYQPDDFLYEASYWIVLLQPYQRRSMIGMDSEDETVIEERSAAEETESTSLDDNDGDLTKEIETFTFNKKDKIHEELVKADTEKARGDSLLNDKILDDSRKRSDCIADTFDSSIKTNKEIIYHNSLPVSNYNYDVSRKGAGNCAILYHRYKMDDIYRISFIIKPTATITRNIPIISDGVISIWMTRKTISVKKNDYIKTFSIGDVAMTDKWNAVSIIMDADELSMTRCSIWQQVEGYTAIKNKFQSLIVESFESSAFDKYYPMINDADAGEIILYGGPYEITNIKIANDPLAASKEFSEVISQISQDMQAMIVSDNCSPRITSKSIMPIIKHPDEHADRKLEQFSVTLSVSPTGCGDTTGSGKYSKGTTVSISASPSIGYVFSSWSDGSLDATRDIIVNDNINLTASFVMVTSVKIINGYLPGLFSVSEELTVKFTRGNLKYTPSSNLWFFSDNQLDIIGESNNEISSDYSGYIDLFGWGTSGWDSGAIAYQPYSTNTKSSDYYPGNDPENDLTGDYKNADWGHNIITNGYNQEDYYRSLTREEWDYLYDGRDNAANLRTRACVNGVNGFIFFPDNWSQPIDVEVDIDTSRFENNTYTLAIWNLLELSGAVFLPAAGDRDNATTDEINEYGDYWSTTHYDKKYAYCFTFNNGREYTYQAYRACGHSVRLVRDIYQITEINIDAPDKITSKGVYSISANLTPYNSNDYITEWTVTDPDGNKPEGVTFTKIDNLNININIDSYTQKKLIVTVIDEQSGVSATADIEIEL